MDAKPLPPHLAESAFARVARLHEAESDLARLVESRDGAVEELRLAEDAVARAKVSARQIVDDARATARSIKLSMIAGAAITLVVCVVALLVARHVNEDANARADAVAATEANARKHLFGAHFDITDAWYIDFPEGTLLKAPLDCDGRPCAKILPPR